MSDSRGNRSLFRSRLIAASLGAAAVIALGDVGARARAVLTAAADLACNACVSSRDIADKGVAPADIGQKLMKRVYYRQQHGPSAPDATYTMGTLRLVIGCSQSDYGLTIAAQNASSSEPAILTRSVSWHDNLNYRTSAWREEVQPGAGTWLNRVPTDPDVFRHATITFIWHRASATVTATLGYSWSSLGGARTCEVTGAMQQVVD